MRTAPFTKELILIAGLLTTAVLAAPREAVRSDHFVEHIGVVTHFNQGHGSDNPYLTRYSQLLQYCRDLGIRYYRQGSASGLDFAEGVADLTGMKLLLLNGYMGSQLWDTTAAAKFMVNLKLHKPSSILAVEGPNEYDNSNRATWPTELQDYSRRCQALMKADPGFSATPIVGSALVGYHPETGNLSSYYDFGGMHWYPAGIEASHGEFNFFDWHYSNIKANTYPGKKIWLTETGYHNATNTNWGVSENAAAKYLPRALMWFLYYKGVERVFSYELVDEWQNIERNNPECHWGLIRHDGTAKPVYKALKNVIGLLKDQDTSFTPTALDYTIEGDTSKIMRKLFQKKSGVYYLAIWQETRSYSQASKTDTTVTPRPLTFKLTTSARRIRVFQPCDPATLSALPTARYENVSQINLSVPDHLVIIEIDRNGVLAPEETKPDLIINKVSISPAAPDPEQVVSFSAMIKNTGLAQNGSAFNVAFYLKDQNGAITALGTEQCTKNIAPGDSFTITCSRTWSSIGGNYSVNVVADTLKSIAELAEDNNAAQSSFVVAFKDYAQGKPVSAGGPNKETWSGPGQAVDGNIWSQWMSMYLPDSLTVDLKDTIAIYEIILGVPAEAADSRDQTIALKGSLDGVNYFTLKTSATYSFHAINGQMVKVQLDKVRARYARAVITANAKNNCAVLARFEVYGVQDKPATAVMKETNTGLVEEVLIRQLAHEIIISIPLGFEGRIFDVRGRGVLSIAGQKSPIHILKNRLAKGTYVVQVRMPGGKLIRQQIAL